MYFAGMELPEHDTDPEEQDHRIQNGEWIDATCEEASSVDISKATVWSSLTDLSNVFGRNQIYTLWGSRDNRTPLVANSVEGTGDNKKCSHMIYKIAGE